MSELPPPAPGTAAGVPVDARDDDVPAEHGALEGTFTTPWRVIVIVAWAAAILAYAAVWKTSEELGIGTWWLGTRSDPTMALVRLLPFVIAAIPAIAAAYNVAWAWWASLGAGVVLIAGAIPDFSRSVGLALLELAIPLATLLVTLASATGRFRGREPAASEGPGDSDG